MLACNKSIAYDALRIPLHDRMLSRDVPLGTTHQACSTCVQLCRYQRNAVSVHPSKGLYMQARITVRAMYGIVMNGDEGVIIQALCMHVWEHVNASACC